MFEKRNSSAANHFAIETRIHNSSRPVDTEPSSTHTLVTHSVLRLYLCRFDFYCYPSVLSDTNMIVCVCVCTLAHSFSISCVQTITTPWRRMRARATRTIATHSTRKPIVWPFIAYNMPRPDAHHFQSNEHIFQKRKKDELEVERKKANFVKRTLPPTRKCGRHCDLGYCAVAASANDSDTPHRTGDNNS